MTLTATWRKLVSFLLSVAMFGHTVAFGQLIGVIIVMSAGPVSIVLAEKLKGRGGSSPRESRGDFRGRQEQQGFGDEEDPLKEHESDPN